MAASGRTLHRGCARLALVAAAVGWAVASCQQLDPVGLSSVSCPNAMPEQGAPCPQPSLRCSYFDSTGCQRWLEATCTADGTWDFGDPCTPAGGTGGTAGTAGTGGSGTGLTGGSGGEGGSSPCDDPVPGPPEVISATAVVYPPDAASDTYELRLSEAVFGLSANLSWSGDGALESVTKVSSKYVVRFADMEPGDVATLTVGTGVTDSCGNPLASAVDIELSLHPRCHYLEQSFEGDFLDEGWSTVDHADDGNVWARNDELDPPNGVPNHTDGSGLCASANDVATGPNSDWDTDLLAPVIDLANASHVVLTYLSDFEDDEADGQAWLEASADGSSWTPLSHWTESHGPSLERVDLSGYAGGELYLRWSYQDDEGSGYWWDVDEVCLEAFTLADCPCPNEGFGESADVDGVSDGNGTMATAEETGAVLTGVGEALSVCGLLEDEDTSGADYYEFDVDAGLPSAIFQATVHYCLENAFQDATISIWDRGSGEQLASVETAHNEGSFEVSLPDGVTYFVALEANAGGADSYAATYYAVRVAIDGGLAPILTEGFEDWPPAAFTVSDWDSCLDWYADTETRVPSGGEPTEGEYLAYFNSYDCPTGSESLTSEPLDLSSATTVVLSFDMYHDTGYPSSYDTIQVQYDDGDDWTDIGPAFERPAEEVGWETETVDLSDLGGSSSVAIRLLATTEYGNDIHIDNVVLLAD